MTNSEPSAAATPADVQKTLEKVEYQGRRQGPRLALLISLLCFLWSVYQLWIASPLPFIFNFAIIGDVPARGIHLSFALLLCFLMYPLTRRWSERGLPPWDIAFALAGCIAALYLFFGWDGLVSRHGLLYVWNGIPVEAILGGVGILLLLDATRRAIGIPLVIVCAVFLVYSIFGQSMPDVISHKGLSLNRLIGYQWLTGEAIFGIPLSVSVSFVFLFVLFGALLDKAGAGQYFLALSFAMVGRFTGGPAKAAILASGMTGMVSGSSIANVVTTGTFTIPVMRRIGMPAVKAGAIEVAASTNGQLMPPIMGAAAFIIAEFIGISYFDVVAAAAIPAVLSYLALLYISHLEAKKLGLKGLPRVEIPPFRQTFLRGAHHLIPIFVLVYLLMVERWSAHSAVFYSILSVMVIIVVRRIVASARGGGQPMVEAVRDGFTEIYIGMVAGATQHDRHRGRRGRGRHHCRRGLFDRPQQRHGRRGRGDRRRKRLHPARADCDTLHHPRHGPADHRQLPRGRLALGRRSGGTGKRGGPSPAAHRCPSLRLLLRSAGGLDATRLPRCLRGLGHIQGRPLKTGVQSFMYDIRTAILPLVFLFNTELLLIGIESIWHGALVAVMSLLAILAFSSLTQGWMFVKVRWYEAILLAAACFMLFRPGFFMDHIAPPFEPVAFQAFVSSTFTPEPGRQVRLHVTRETDYGERYKLFVLETPVEQATTPAETFGVGLEREDDGRYAVVDLAWNGMAEQAGIDWGTTSQASTWSRRTCRRRSSSTLPA